MNKNCRFTEEERFAIISALETYIENPNASVFGLTFKSDIKQKLGDSCLKKLYNYSPLTYFTKQEYTLMYAATLYIDIITDAENIEIFANSSASKKLGELADNV